MTEMKKEYKKFGEKEYLCGDCQKTLERVHLGGMDMMSMFAQSTFYCKNKKCDKAFLITVGGIEKPATQKEER